MIVAWSRLAGEIFLDWIAPRPGLRWVDVGCGNGAFTELVVERYAPAEVQGIDPSEGQLKYARARPATRRAEFRQNDAMALPFPASKFDAAVMALVIVFVPDPAKGVAEMGYPLVRQPSSDVSKIETLQKLWRDAGLDSVEARKIEVQNVCRFRRLLGDSHARIDDWSDSGLYGG